MIRSVQETELSIERSLNKKFVKFSKNKQIKAKNLYLISENFNRELNFQKFPIFSPFNSSFKFYERMNGGDVNFLVNTTVVANRLAPLQSHL